MINIKPLQIKPVVFPWVNETTEDGLVFVKEHPGRVEMPDLLECYDFRIIQEEVYPLFRGLLQDCTVNFKSIFTTYVRFMGFEKAVMEMNANDLTEIANVYTVWNHKLLAARKADCIIIGDDLAGNTGPFVSPETMEKKYFPIMKRFISSLLYLSPGADVVFHSCGDIYKLLGQIADLPMVSSINYQRVGTMEKIKDGDYMTAHGAKIEFNENKDPFYGTKYQKESA